MSGLNADWAVSRRAHKGQLKARKPLYRVVGGGFDLVHVSCRSRKPQKGAGAPGLSPRCRAMDLAPLSAGGRHSGRLRFEGGHGEPRQAVKQRYSPWAKASRGDLLSTECRSKRRDGGMG